MEYTFIIKGRLPGLNEYIDANRANRHKGAKFKSRCEKIIIGFIKQQLKGLKITKPVYINFTWIEQNRRRDKDNVSSFGRKVILDALVKASVLKNDNWNCVVGFSDIFRADKENPHIIVHIQEVEGWVI